VIAALILFPAAEQAAEELVAVPRLTGRPHADVERDLEALGLTIESTTELPHPFEPAGTVTAQSPVPGQRLHAGAGVRLAVSTGRPQLQVPDLIGLPYRDAASLAEALGFTVNRREEAAPGAVGAVIKVEPAPGTPRELPATIVLVVTAPPAPAPDETLTDDGLGELFDGPADEPRPEIQSSGDAS
jgi:serine/threonine-protein kinase